MPDRPIVLLALTDGDRAERLAAALEADGDLLPSLDARPEEADVSVRERGLDGGLTISAAAAHDGESAAEGELPSGADDALIVAAVRLVAAGFRLSRAGAPDDAVRGAAPIANGGVAERPRPTLSARELEVLALLADGAPNKVIARRLDISVHTAKFHVASLLTKLGAVNRTDAIVIAMREGLVPV